MAAERIMVIESSRSIIKGKQGLILCERKDVKSLLQPCFYAFRDAAERTTMYKQIIPYVVLINSDNEVFTYLRGKAGNEENLHDLYSIGLGGHIDYTLNMEHNSLFTGLNYHQVLNCALRELKEEVGLKTEPKHLRLIGLLQDDATKVGKRHLGVVLVVNVPKDIKLDKGEVDVVQSRSWVPMKKLVTLTGKYKFEEWSQHLIDFIKAAGNYDSRTL